MAFALTLSSLVAVQPCPQEVFHECLMLNSSQQERLHQNFHSQQAAKNGYGENIVGAFPVCLVMNIVMMSAKFIFFHFFS